MKDLPENFKLQFSAAEISARIAALSSDIAAWIQDSEKQTGQPVVAVCVLRGAVFYFSDLLRAIPVSVETGFLRTWTYFDDSEMRGSVKIAEDDFQVEGRAMLIVDEICDTGSTLKALKDGFLKRGAIDVQASVAVWRKVPNSKFSPRWSAFEFVGDEWLVGYGMDSSNRYRNAPDIYRIVKS